MEILDFVSRLIMNLLPKLPTLILTLLIGYLLIKITVWILGASLRLAKMPKLKGIILSATKLILWVILVIYIANNLGLTQLAVAISGTVLVLVFFLNTGLGPLITDAVSGIFLCTDPDFKAGSKVRFGKGKDAVEGVINEIDMRKVRLTDDKGFCHVLPNSVVDREMWTVIEKTTTVKKTHVAKEIIKKKIKRNNNAS